MFRVISTYQKSFARFPRVRGDVPSGIAAAVGVATFSPRARGCSGVNGKAIFPLQVFPACAGMFRSPCPHRPGTDSFPRVRGDVPWRLV